MAKKKFYAVRRGRQIGVFTTWAECQRQTVGFSGADFKSFPSAEAAEAWIDSAGEPVAGGDVPTGGIAVDGAMTATSLLLEMNPPRVAHAMAERFLQDIPFITRTLHRSGQLMGLPEHAMKILEADRLLMVFPEGARGTGKLYWEKYELVRFGTGFMRLALQTGSPIVPFGFVGGVEAMPNVYHSKLLARIANAPYFPITAYLLPFPRPYPCRVYFGEPLYFEGNGDETDDVIAGYVETVKDSIRALIRRGLEERGEQT